MAALHNQNIEILCAFFTAFVYCFLQILYVVFTASKCCFFKGYGDDTYASYDMLLKRDTDKTDQPLSKFQIINDRNLDDYDIELTLKPIEVAFLNFKDHMNKNGASHITQ